MSAEDSASKQVAPVAVPPQNTPFELDASKRISSRKPRQRHRSVPMKVLVLGLSRTGTLSIRQALFQLGYFDVYHGTSFGSEDDRGRELWDRAIQAKFENGPPFHREDWNELFGHYMAVADWPCAAFAEELISAYPEAKVILSVRDSAEQWKQSAERTIVPVAENSGTPSVFYRMLARLAPRIFKVHVYHKVMHYTRLLYIPKEGVRQYHEHNSTIEKLVPPENLLVFNVKQGWQPLCRFLDCDIPSAPFPRVNSEEQFLVELEKWKEGMRGGTMLSRVGKSVYSSSIGPAIAIVASLLLWSYLS